MSLKCFRNKIQGLEKKFSTNLKDSGKSMHNYYNIGVKNTTKDSEE